MEQDCPLGPHEVCTAAYLMLHYVSITNQVILFKYFTIVLISDLPNSEFNE